LFFFCKAFVPKKLFTKALFAFFYIRKVMKKVNSIKITGISELRDLKLVFCMTFGWVEHIGLISLVKNRGKNKTKERFIHKFVSPKYRKYPSCRCSLKRKK
jgi:hypothetical protein